MAQTDLIKMSNKTDKPYVLLHSRDGILTFSVLRTLEMNNVIHRKAIECAFVGMHRYV